MTRSPALPMRLALVAIAAGLVVSGCGPRTPRAAALPPAATVLALGDSLTFGTGANDEASYPSVLAASTGWNVVNAGVPGETAAEGCARLAPLIDEHRPRLVLVLLGGNDFLRRMPDDGIRSGLANCVATARAQAAPIVLITVPRLGFGGIANAELYAALGNELSVPVVDAGLADLFQQSSMRADRVHLNADGYRAMAAAVAQALRKLGYLDR